MRNSNLNAIYAPQNRPRRFCRLLPARNMSRLTVWRGINTVAATLLVWALGNIALAQQPAAPAPAPAPAPAAAAPVAAAEPLALDEAIARQVYSVTENWVRRVRLPDETTPILVKDLSAVHVTIRREGATIGQATAALPDPLNPPAAGADVMALAREATGEALRQAVTTYVRPLDMAQRSAELMLDIQFAGPVTKLRLQRLAELPQHVITSRDGLALQHGAAWSWCMPGNSIAANTNLQGQVNRLLAGANLPVDQIERIGSADGPVLHRYDVIHLVRPQPGAEVVRLHRGSVLLPPVVLQGALLATLSDQYVEHLLLRQLADGRFAGTYEPTSGRYAVAIASTSDTAFAAYALARASKLAADPQRQQQLADAAMRGLQAALKGDTDDAGQIVAAIPHVAPTAMTLLALLEVPGGGELKDERTRLVANLRTMQQPGGLFHTVAGAGGRVAPISGQAVAAAALTALYDRTRDPQILTAAQAALKAIWPLMTPEQAPFAMPFLVQAEMDLARLGQPTGSAAKFKPIADALWKRQIAPWSDPQQAKSVPDTVGGFAWGGEPTWQSAQVLAGLAMLLKDEQVTPADQRAAQLAAAGLGARFLAQLTIQTPGAYYIRRPGEAVGGVRLALWDNRQPLFATATALLAVTELQRTTGELVNR